MRHPVLNRMILVRRMSGDGKGKPPPFGGITVGNSHLSRLRQMAVNVGTPQLPVSTKGFFAATPRPRAEACLPHERLFQGETDGSSFPNGGLRHAAKGSALQRAPTHECGCFSLLYHLAITWQSHPDCEALLVSNLFFL